MQLWKSGKLELVISLDILEEYHRVAETISKKFPQIDITTILELISLRSVMVDISKPYPKITADPDDDKFMVCAEASNTEIVISGDSHLLDVNGYKGIKVLTPRQFIKQFKL